MSIYIPLLFTEMCLATATDCALYPDAYDKEDREEARTVLLRYANSGSGYRNNEARRLANKLP